MTYGLLLVVGAGVLAFAVAAFVAFSGSGGGEN